LFWAREFRGHFFPLGAAKKIVITTING